MTDTPSLHAYRCLECGFAWRSDNPEEPCCPACESGDIVMISYKHHQKA